jgi:uncharacterized Fe-S cluster-containing radical SAM superfamily protein
MTINPYYTNCTIDITDNCNFKCVHCYVKHDNNKTCIGIDPIKHIEKLISKLDLIKIHLFGGEPLLNPDFIEIYNYLYKKKYQLTVSTNLSLLEEKHLELFKKKPPTLICVSIYGSNSIEYIATTGNDAYGTVFNNLNILKNNYIKKIDHSCQAYKTKLNVDTKGYLSFCPFSSKSKNSLFIEKNISKVLEDLTLSFINNYKYPDYCFSCKNKELCKCPIILNHYSKEQLKKECCIVQYKIKSI